MNPDPNDYPTIADCRARYYVNGVPLGPDPNEAFILTHSGKRFYLFRPTPEMVDIDDIAWALSNACRYTGHVSRFYSVAEHSVHVARWLAFYARAPARIVLAGLLHDASEAYLTDVPSPIKPFLGGYHEMEARIQACIAAKFGLTVTELNHPLVKEADKRILLNEARELMPTDEIWSLIGSDLKPLGGVRIEGYPPEYARFHFLEWFKDYQS